MQSVSKEFFLPISNYFMLVMKQNTIDIDFTAFSYWMNIVSYLENEIVKP